MTTRLRHPFQTELEQIGAQDATGQDATGQAASGQDASEPKPFSRLTPPDAEPERETGSHYLWDRAADWVPGAEADAAPEPPAHAPAPSVDPAAIAAELGLSRLSTFDDLNRARRRFMWDNHPDRRADVPREIAHRRVATANMLLDRAYAHIERRTRKR